MLLCCTGREKRENLEAPNGREWETDFVSKCSGGEFSNIRRRFGENSIGCSMEARCAGRKSITEKTMAVTRSKGSYSAKATVLFIWGEKSHFKKDSKNGAKIMSNIPYITNKSCFRRVSGFWSNIIVPRMSESKYY